MLQTWLKSLFAKTEALVSQTPSASSTTAPKVVPATAQAPVYPPIDQGLPVNDPQALLDSNVDLIQRLRLHAAMDAPVFDARFIAPLRNLAEQVNTLPATSSGLFSGHGGLFRAALEMAFFSFQASDGRIFTGNETVERRHALETRWRYVSFLGGMFYPLGRCLDTVVVTGADGKAWRRHFGSLTQWAQQGGTSRIFASWPDQDETEQQVGPSTHIASMIAQVVGADNLQWLDDGSPELVKALYEISSGQPSSARNCQDVIATVWMRISRREEARRPQAFGRQKVGTHLGPYLVGAIRTLLATPTWKLNGDRVRADASGVYLVWPEAIEDIANFGQREQIQGWPTNPATIAELLKASGIVTNNGEEMGMVEVVADEGEIVRALQIKNPLSVMEDFDPDALDIKAPKTVAAVIAADPLAAAEAKAERVQRKKPEPKAKPVPAGQEFEDPLASLTAPSQPDLLQRESDSESEVGEQQPPQSTAQSEEPEGLRAAESLVPLAISPAPAVEADGQAAPAIKEAAEVKYSDLVPSEVQKDIKKRLHIELLGKVMKAWRDRGEASKHMRMTDHGAAIALEFLNTIVRDVPGWVGEMAAAGLVYSPAATPGLKINKVSIPEGAKPKECVILSRFAVKKLGL